MIPYVFDFAHLEAPFYVERVIKVTVWEEDILLIAELESTMLSWMGLTYGRLASILGEV